MECDTAALMVSAQWDLQRERVRKWGDRRQGRPEDLLKIRVDLELAAASA